MFITLLVVFLVGVISASFGTLVGGGTLLTIPTFIFLGLSPESAIATNRFGANGLIIAGLYEFNKKRLVNYKIGFIICIPALLGSFLGAIILLQIINELILKYLIVIVTILILSFIIFKPKIGIEKTKLFIKKTDYLSGIALSFLIGINSGLYGAGSGTFLSYVLILLFGQTFLESAATRKIPTLFSSLIATLIFILASAIIYPIGISLFIGNLIGSYLGAHYSDKLGNVWIKRLFIVIILIMVIKLIT